MDGNGGMNGRRERQRDGRRDGGRKDGGGDDAMKNTGEEGMREEGGGKREAGGERYLDGNYRCCSSHAR
jgi:hypothetical protein